MNQWRIRCFDFPCYLLVIDMRFSHSFCRDQKCHIEDFSHLKTLKICVASLLVALTHPPSKQVKATLPPRAVPPTQASRSMGLPWHPQIVADQLTLSPTEGADYAHQITTSTPGFSDLPMDLLCIFL